MPVFAIILWAILLGSVLIIFIQKIKGKIKYKDVKFEYDSNWFENSLNKYPSDDNHKYYYFHPDKNFFAQGHVLEDINHNVVYEAKFLYNNMLGNDEVDFVNHIINYTHHHKVGHTSTSSVGYGNVSKVVNSSFKFDGEDVYDYLQAKGYSYKFNIQGLAYTIDIFKNNQTVAKILSSNNGKNLYESQSGIVEAKMGGVGINVIQSDYKNLDAAFLYAMVFARTELSSRNL